MHRIGYPWTWQSYEALRAVGYTNDGGADVAEVIAICSRIPAGDEDIWLREWNAAGERAATNARTSLAAGNNHSARDAFLRASNYFRTAEFFRREDPHNDNVSKSIAGLSSQMFYAAAELMSHSTKVIHIPYEGTSIPGTLMRVDDSDTPRPTIIVNGGYDSTREELGYAVAATALQMGFNVVAIDGPGQSEALRKKRLVFRYDWEKVITPVVDYVLGQPYSDKDKLVIMGVSMGGYLVARAAAFEHRAAAIILNDGVYDFGSAFRNNTPSLGKLMIRHNWDGTMNAIIRQLMKWDTCFRWGILNGQWVFGVSSEVDVLRAVEAYTLEGVVEKIQTPVLVLDAPDDHFLKGQPRELFRRLRCEKQFVEMGIEEGAAAHCHMGAGGRLNQVVFDYLLQRFRTE
ncbi:20-hydroxy-prefusarin hydrolase FUS2 [Fusarium oxysporum f. sp. cubense]|uniref:20-hydroxy-prefusarin hydrolase FUS2 n=1 Tax=Fusarium oxysporum f. sp. cubense TaxID=61366 RepID=A0A559KRJ6_FUSOC|nr:20-hydroxy-prefusarin hydrolase FUS2 [Fusarium oxysporum f. sp. cubense]TVY62667.1 20-hydroxy-prefusarin hydrolase FUS2 [Fusarium oxysporum f. sp. cubense]